MYLKLLGDLALFEHDAARYPLVQGRRPLLVVAYLAISPERSVSRTRLAELIWPDRSPSSRKGSLRSALNFLKSAADGAGARWDKERVWLDSAVTVDLIEFLSAVSLDRPADALPFYGGRLLGGVEQWASGELLRECEAVEVAVDRGVSVAFRSLVTEHLEAGRLQEAVSAARKLASLNPVSEEAQLTLIRTLRAARDDNAALLVFEAYKSLLESELGGHLSPDQQVSIEALRMEAFKAPNPLSVVYVPTSAPAKARAKWVAAGALGALAIVAATVAIVAPGSARDETVKVVAEVSDAFAFFEIGARTVGPGRRVSAPVPDGDWLVSPSGESVAYTESGRGGRDIVVRDLAGGAQGVRFAGPGDEHMLAWSPDSRFLLIRSRHDFDDDEDGEYWAFVLDTTTGDRSRLGTFESADFEVEGAWSGDGRRIVLLMADGDGSLVSVFSPDGLHRGEFRVERPDPKGPAISPDGRWVAFLYRSSDPDPALLNLDTGALLSPPATLGFEGPPLWTAGGALIFPIMVDDLNGGGRRVVRFHRYSFRDGAVDAVEVTSAEHLKIGAMSAVAESGYWIDSLEVELRAGPLALGEHRLPSVRGFLASGQEVPVRVEDVAFMSEEPSIVQAQGGMLVARDIGETEVVATLEGWRTVRFPVLVRPLGERALASLLADDWSGGLNPSSWLAFGDSLPTVHVRADGAAGSYLLSNGTGSRTSGVASTEVFPLGLGLTLDLKGWVGTERRDHQNLEFGLVPAEAAPGFGEPLSDLGIVVAFHGRTQSLRISYPGGVQTIPFYGHEGAEHEYSLQLSHSALALVVDGRMLVNEPLPKAWVRPEKLRVVLAGRSVGAEIKHGPVRLSSGLRYSLER